MAKLMDIKGYWNMSSGYNFNNKDMWEGKILLNEDGWFEGIAVDPSSSYSEDRFIFGVYHPEKIIELYKFTPINVSAPFVFHGKRNDNCYDGEFEMIHLFGTVPCGKSRIVTQIVDSVRENIEEDTNRLEKRINRYKQGIMDEIGKEFYDNSISIRNAMCKIILGNYEGREYTSEEIQQLMDECQMVNDRVMSATEEHAKKLLKKYTGNQFIDDDDELPFH